MANKEINDLDPLAVLNTADEMVWRDASTGMARRMALPIFLSNLVTHEPQNWYGQLAKIERAIIGDTDWTNSQAVLALIGDSWIEGGAISRPLTQWLHTEYGNAGDGYVGIGMSHGAPWAYITYTRVGTWTDRDSDAPGSGLDVADATSSDISTPAKVTIVGTFNAAVIQYIKRSGGGDFRWRVDGGSWTTVATANASDLHAVETISGLSTANHTIEIEVSNAGSSGVRLLGVDCKRSARGVRVHRLGNGGSTAAHYAAANATIWQAGLSALAPTAVALLLGTNDMAANIPPTTFGSSIDTIVSRIQAALPLTDVILLSPADNGLTGKTYTVAEYRDELRNAAMRDGCTFINTYDVIGSYTDGNSRSLYSNSAHLNTAGGQVLSDCILRKLKAV